MHDMSGMIWTLAWWFGTMVLTIVGVVLLCMQRWWAAPCLIAALVSCVVDAGWGLWESEWSDRLS